jgi:predicted unusual protein kinase regulating ubiquinone biosynthesis (AarF/ABC1/UbiB family)
MKLSANHLKRYKEIGLLLWKYGHSDLVKQMGVAGALDVKEVEQAGDGRGSPAQFADDLEAMGPTYVKLGQVLAGRPDLLPEAYTAALERLQDNVKPFPFAEVEQIVSAELGVRISKAFARFDPEPIAAASLGQVHFAELRDGRPVVVKVQRPNIRLQIAEDFEVLAQIAEFFDTHTDLGRRYRFLTILDEFRASIQQEMDYQQEAQNLVSMGENLQEFPLLLVPQPVADYTTRCVLTMDHIRGRKVTSFEPLARLDIKGAPLAEELFKAYLKQVLIDGLFHADPHPGNVFLTDDGRIALLDLGMVGHIAPGMQENLLKVLLAVSEGNSEEAADIVIRMSQKTENFDSSEFHRRIRQVMALSQNQGLQRLKVGRTLLHLSQDAGGNGLLVPSELTLLGKTLLQLDEVGRILDPGFDPNASIRRNAIGLMTRRMKRDMTQGSMLSSLLEAKDFVSHLPSRLNRLMDGAVSGELEVKVKAVDAKIVLDGMQKIANRITAGIILAALIIGAALLMRVPTQFQLFGYPGLAILCFLAAAAGGCWLLFNIFAHDQKSPKRRVP